MLLPSPSIPYFWQIGKGPRKALDKFAPCEQHDCSWASSVLLWPIKGGGMAGAKVSETDWSFAQRLYWRTPIEKEYHAALSSDPQISTTTAWNNVGTAVSKIISRVLVCLATFAGTRRKFCLNGYRHYVVRLVNKYLSSPLLSPAYAYLLPLPNPYWRIGSCVSFCFVIFFTPPKPAPAIKASKWSDSTDSMNVDTSQRYVSLDHWPKKTFCLLKKKMKY